jgi:DNA-binding transcriptional LysR family regulator
MGRPRKSRGASELDPEHDRKTAPSATSVPTIPTNLLRTFVALDESGSFTKAAQLLHVAQPAISLHMKRLEALIGADLLVKNTTGVRPTERGLEVLRLGRRILSINAQIFSSAGQPSPRVIRIGIPSIFAPSKLARILNECRGKAGVSLQVSCDHSRGLLHSVRSGYLDIVFAVGTNEDLRDAVATWSVDLVWVRAPDFMLQADAVVPLISSPNLLQPDRTGIAALEQANRRYQVVFTAFDTMARCAAAAAGLGYYTMPRSLVAKPLVIEEPGVLPPLPPATAGIIVREDLDTQVLEPLVSTFKSILMSYDFPVSFGFFSFG